MSNDDTASSRRSRRNHNEDDDEEEERTRSRRSRRAVQDDDDEETTSRSSRRSRRTQEDDEEEDTSSSSRRSRRRGGDDDEEEETTSSRSTSSVTISSSSAPAKKSIAMGATMKDMNEARRKRVQQAILDGMAKYAEQKFGRKRAAPKSSKPASAMDDYEIYMRSVKAKIKTSNDRLNAVLKQKRDIDEKVSKAEKEVQKNEQILRDAEDEKDVAESEGRDPKLPSGFVVPQQAKKAAAGSGFANLVMKASAQLWEDKFMAMRAKKGGNEGQPEWMNKTKSRDKVLVNVGKKPGHKKEEEHKPSWGANLKKSEPRRRGGDSKSDDRAEPAFAKVGLRKTARKDDEEEQGSKKVDWKDQMVKKPGSASSRRRRGGDDSD